MPHTELELPVCTCQRCGWTWTPRIPRPRRCPKCKSVYWDDPTGMKKPRTPKRTYSDQ